MYSCTMTVPDPPPPPEEAVSVKKKCADYMILREYTVMVLGGSVEVWGCLGCFGVVWGVSMDGTTVMLTVR